MPVQVSAPGRICLFGEHQDYLGLAVIAAPVDLDVKITGTPRENGTFRIHMPDLRGSDEPDYDEFEVGTELPYLRSRDYIRSATNVLRRAGLPIHQGYDCEVRGTIPMNRGISSSSACTIAWVTFLLRTQNGHLEHAPEEIARLGYEAEVKEFNEPGGMMDHYTSALGGLLYIDCQEPISVTRLPARLGGFVIGDTRVPKDTTGILRRSREATSAGMAILRERMSSFDLRTTALEEAREHFSAMEPEVRRRVEANFINRDLCREAHRMLSGEQVDSERLGAMLHEHQAHLRDGIGVSHPRLDELIDAAMEAGALGGKLNGSGCGGAMFAYAPGRQEQVAEAIERAGGKAYVVNLRDGVTITDW